MLSEENVERTHDLREQEAFYAIVYAAASRGKGKNGKLPSVTDLYNREGVPSEEKVEDALEMQKQAYDWLNNFDLTRFTGEEEN